MHTPTGCSEPQVVEKSQTDLYNPTLSTTLNATSDESINMPANPCWRGPIAQKATRQHPAYLFWKLQSRLTQLNNRLIQHKYRTPKNTNP